MRELMHLCSKRYF